MRAPGTGRNNACSMWGNCCSLEFFSKGVGPPPVSMRQTVVSLSALHREKKVSTRGDIFIYKWTVSAAPISKTLGACGHTLGSYNPLGYTLFSSGIGIFPGDIMTPAPTTMLILGPTCMASLDPQMFLFLNYFLPEEHRKSQNKL